MKTLLLSLALFCLTVQSFAQTGSFEWIKRIGDTGDESIAQITNDPAGNTYVTGSFIGQLIFGTTTLTSNSISQPSAFVVKYDSSGNVLWAQKAPITNMSYGISIYNVRVSSSGRVMLLGSCGNGAIGKAYLAVYRADGSLVAYSDQATNNTNQDVDFDSVDNSYIIGSTGSSPNIYKLDSNGNIKWSYVFSVPSSFMYAHIKYVNGQVHLTGQFKYQTTFTDTTGTTPITLTASGGINDYDYFWAIYSKNGKLLAATRHQGTMATAGGPFDNGDITSANTWRVTDLDPMQYVRARAFTSSFVISDSGTFLNRSSCLAPPPIGITCDHFNNESVFTTALFAGLASQCGFLEVYVLDSTDKVSKTMIAPYAGPSSSTPVRRFSFDANRNLFIVSTFQGTINYTRNAQKDSMSSAAGSVDLYVGKYHNCQRYNPTIGQSHDTVRCSLNGMYYQWYYTGDTTLYAAGSAPYYVPSKAGNMRVVVIDNWACTDTSGVLTVTIGPGGVSSHQTGSRLTVLPNPTSGTITITGIHPNESIRLVDMLGRTIVQFIAHGDSETISLSSMPSGVYVLEANSTRIRIVKE